MALWTTERIAQACAAPGIEGPLCIDLDGTLLRADILHECIAESLHCPSVLLRIPFYMARGRAFLKARLAEAAPPDVTTLPYDPDVLEMIKRERATGRRVVLVTATDRRIADRISAHLGLFDEVIASDGTTNLKGKKKAEELVRHFGTRGFSYAGNDNSDLTVWKESESAIVVGNPGLRRRAAAVTRVEQVLPGPRKKLSSLLQLFRPYQWSKNLLVFVPLLTANDISSVSNWMRCVGLFFALSVMASALYVLNDITDLRSDRAHPRKRLRGLASGYVSLRTGFALLIPGVGLALALAAVNGSFTLVLLYGALSFLYSTCFKRFPLIDIFMLAGIYAVRIFAGGVVGGHLVSVWLLTFSIFLFFSLAAVKRTAELVALPADNQKGSRRGYFAGDAPALEMMGVSSSFMSCLVLAFYVQSLTVQQNYTSPDLLWGIIVLVLFWQCRLWLATLRGRMQDDPIIFAAKDWVSWLVACAVVAIMLLAHSHLFRGISFLLS
jgi:4-hydroxybenzoate polyprenyltransferase